MNDPPVNACRRSARQSGGIVSTENGLDLLGRLIERLL